MSDIKSLLTNNMNPQAKLMTETRGLQSKWDKTGLLEGLNGVDKAHMSILLENQAQQLLNEATATGTSANSEQWAGVALPLVRRVFAEISAKEFVSVQPMNMPSGLVFFLDFQYGNSKTPFTSGQSLYGNRNTASQFPFSTPAPVGGLYGGPEGRFTYATNQFSASAVAVVQATTFTSASFAEVNFSSDFSASAAAGSIKKLTVATSSISADIDILGVRGFIITSGSVSAARNLNEFTYFSSGNVVFFVSASTAEIPTSSSFVVEYNKLTKDNARGDFEAGASYAVPNAESASEIVIPQINVQMRSEAIVAKTKKLKAQWTPEFAQDLNAYHSLDAEAELTAVMSEYISLEIDLEILDMLIESAAAGTEYWTALNNGVYNPNNANGFDFPTSTTQTGFFNTQGQWFQTLGTKMQKLSNIIHQRTLRGGANFCVVSPTVATILESIPGFASTSNGDVSVASYAFGVQKMGQINNRYTIYKNPYMKENTILMGFKGSQFLETGAVFAPYIPLIMTPLVYDPDTFVPRKGLLTRYAKKMVRPEFYGKIYVSGLNTL